MNKQKIELEQKDKIVSFKLSKEMAMPTMLREGYQRKEIEILFEKLQEAGFGEYIAGRPGKGCYAKFVANDKCPNKYVIAFRVKRLHKDYAGVPDTKSLIVKRDDGTEEVINDKPLSVMDKILLIKRQPKNIPVNLNNGYVCSVAEGYVFVDKISNGGFNSIEEAINDIWGDIRNSVPAKGTKLMTPKDEVVSSLMGKRFYKLK